MKILDTSFISSTAFQPVKQGTLDLLQDAHKQTTDALAKALIGSSYDATKVYILNGCVATGTDPGARTVTAGAVFFNGEVYLVDAFSGTTTGSNVLVGSVDISFVAAANADPVLFTDGSSHNVHQVRKMLISMATAGSGTADFSDWVALEWSSSIFTAGTTVSSGAGTVTKVILRWKTFGGTTILNYTLEVNISSYASGVFAISIPMPVATNYTPTGLDDLIRGAAILFTSGGSQLIASGLAFNSTLFLQATNQSVTGATFIYGQISYPS